MAGIGSSSYNYTPVPPTQTPSTGGGGVTASDIMHLGQSSHSTYRSDAGSFMTDQEYAAWKTSNKGGMAGQQTSSDIQTKAQEGLASQAAGFASTQQQAQIAAAQRLQDSQLAEAQRAQETGIAGQKSLQGEAETANLTSMNQQASLQAAAEARRQSAMNGLMSQLGINSGTISDGMSSGGAVAGTSQEDAARSAAFARAKDQAGQIGRSAVTGLQEAGAARGIGGSGIVGSQVGQAVNTGATQLGDVNREQLIQDLQNARDRATQQLNAGVTMRGQNISLLQGALGGLTAAY